MSVLTPTLPERSRLLHECKQSVAAQTVPAEHLVVTDTQKEGPGVLRNRLAETACGDWLLPLDDDDVLDPPFLEILLPYTHDFDVVYGWCRVEGIDWTPNRLFRADTLKRYNFIPVTALIRKSLFQRVGGFMDTKPEDWDLWKRCLEAGARFKCVDEVVWTYRVQPDSRNWAQ